MVRVGGVGRRRGAGAARDAARTVASVAPAMRAFACLPRRQHRDALAGALARCIATRAEGRIGPLLQRELRGQREIVSGKRKLDEPTGRRILEEMARNDPRSVHELEGKPLKPSFGIHPQMSRTGGWMLDEQEWGLIRENVSGEVHLILGGKNGVQWGPYLDEGTPLAHSHPWRQGMRTRTTTVDAITMDALLAQDSSWAALMVLPTISDFVLPARQGQRSHTVFTPYVVDDDGVVRDPADGDTQIPRLTWELTDIDLDEESHQVSGRLSATSAGRTVWTRSVRADSTDLKGTQYTIIGTPPNASAGGKSKCCIVM